MSNKIFFGLLFGIIITSGCNIIQKSAKTNFEEGFYMQKKGEKLTSVYVTISADTISSYAVKNVGGKKVSDSLSVIHLAKNDFLEKVKPLNLFVKQSLDIDFLTIPLKFRPSKKGVPPQLNTNLNGAAYLGFRTDKYKIVYTTKPFGKSERSINHYGFSYGIFSGFGNSALSPTTTNNKILLEYDGIVWSKGIAGIIAINNFTLGVVIGFDNLLDHNKRAWIYESKPWLGLALGLNIN